MCKESSRGKKTTYIRCSVKLVGLGLACCMGAESIVRLVTLYLPLCTRNVLGCSVCMLFDEVVWIRPIRRSNLSETFQKYVQWFVSLDRVHSLMMLSKIVYSRTLRKINEKVKDTNTIFFKLHDALTCFTFIMMIFLAISQQVFFLWNLSDYINIVTALII